jgi:hypothetical protein
VNVFKHQKKLSYFYKENEAAAFKLWWFVFKHGITIGIWVWLSDTGGLITLKRLRMCGKNRLRQRFRDLGVQPSTVYCWKKDTDAQPKRGPHGQTGLENKGTTVPQRFKIQRQVPLLLCTAMMCGGHLYAQDSHYWTQKYGTQSTLLGGAVIGSALDISATFYNPGALALMTKPASLLGGLSWEAINYRINDGVGENLDLDTWQFGTVPDFIVGTFKHKNSHIGYSLLKRQRFHVRLRERIIADREAIARSDGPEPYTGEVLLENHVSGDWGGLTWSKKVHERISIGLTGYLAGHSQLLREQVISQALTDRDVAVTNAMKEIEYGHWRLLSKAGIAVDFQPVTLGLSLTTPSLGVFGTGTVFESQVVTGQDVDGDGREDVRKTSAVQKEQDAVYKTSWAVGIGASYRLKRGSSLHASVEWYAAVDPFSIIKPQEFQDQSSGEPFSLGVMHATQSVINIGFGFEYQFTTRFSGYGSLGTDYSYADPSSDLTVTDWDLYHLITGAGFKVAQYEITFGIGYTWGSSQEQQKVNFDDVNERNELLGTRGMKDSTYRKLLLLAGFSISLK